MRGLTRVLVVMCVLVATTLVAPASAQDVVPYIDNRSTPETLLASLASAFSRREGARVQHYFDRAEAGGFTAGTNWGGFTRNVSILTGPTSRIVGDEGDTIYYVPAVVILTSWRDDQVRVETGCYVMRRPPIDSRWFRPLAIVSYTLTPAGEDVRMPSDCGSNPARQPEADVPLDDRSTPEALILSFHDALARGEFARARNYALGQTPTALIAHADLLAQAASVVVGAGNAEPEEGGVAMVPMILMERDGEAATIGCYAIRAARTETFGFESMKIVGVHFTGSEALACRDPAEIDVAPSEPEGPNDEPRVVMRVEERPYRDDRSNPEVLIQSYYNALNRREYARAAGYWAAGAGISAEALAEEHAFFVNLGVFPSPATYDPSGNITTFHVYVLVQLTYEDGDTHAVARCYSMRLIEEDGGGPRKLTIVEASQPNHADACGAGENRLEIGTRRDDRSDAASLVRSLYDALYRADYARAWSYFAVPPEASFEDYVAGFADTGEIMAVVGNDLRIVIVDGESAVSVPIEITAMIRDGAPISYSGCYFVGPPHDAAEGPFEPAAIVGWDIGEGSGSAALQRCADGVRPGAPPIVEPDPATAAFGLAYAGICMEPYEHNPYPEEPAIYEIPGPADEPKATWQLYVFFCSPGMYSSSYAFFAHRADGSVEQLTFAIPAVDFDIKGDPEFVESATFRGFHVEYDPVDRSFDPTVLFDPVSMTVFVHHPWRAGPSDAFTEGRWMLLDGRFVLVDYDIDPTFDFDQNPIPIVRDGQVVLQ
ncbi:MAG: hypothetical protein KIS96_03895 [Bauldia sp.]|nr:hypothetical protein [Bauldia sp.]